MEEYRKMRRFKQQITKEECIEVLQTAPRGIMAFNGENGYPYAIPLNQFYDKTDGKLYFHCAKEGLKLDLLNKNNKVCFTVMDKGFVKENEWALNIKSVVCLGNLEIITNRETVIDKCRKLSQKFYPSPEAIEKEIEQGKDRVNMFAMTILHMSGKLVNES